MYKHYSKQIFQQYTISNYVYKLFQKKVNPTLIENL